MGFSVENVCGFLIKSQLLTPEQTRALYERWQFLAGSDAKQRTAFLKWLVAAGHVTEWQANLLGQGHTDGFFLNQYKILERIGRGRMAGVYRAAHNLGQVVAIKVLPPSRARNPQILGRFQRETQLAMRLKHPNVVRSFQTGEAAGVHYLVMEHLEGETLEELLRRRRSLAPADACRLVHQTLLGLQHLHEQGMVHRDIKPSNLFLQIPDKDQPPDDSLLGSPDGVNPADCTVKILDIGLAREFFDEPPAPANGPDGAGEITAEGMLLGTPDYMAPEQAHDPRRSDIRADVYSAGCVLYHLLTGQPPFPDRSLFNQIVRHATEKPRPLRSFNAAIPEGLEQIVGWMMAKEPDKRYPTPERAAKALEVFLLVGAQRPARAEAPQMRRYLTWLETEGKQPAATVAPAAPARPRAAPEVLTATPVKPRAPAAPIAAPAAAPIAAPVAAPARAVVPAPVEVDVELVPPSELTAPAQVIADPATVKPAAGRSRKKLLIGIAVAAVVLSCGCAGAVGWGISKLFE